MERRDLLIHLGYPRTASSWLQQRVFNHRESGLWTPWENARPLLIHSFVLEDGYVWDPEAARNRFAEGRSRAREAGVTAVLSDETLVGDAISRNYWGQMVIDRIAKAFGDASLLVIVREQRSMALSMYRQYVMESGVHALTAFIGHGDEPMSYTPWLRPEHLMYDRIIEYCINRFSRDRVLVLPFEWIKSGPAVFLRRIQDYVGVKSEYVADPREVNRSWPVGVLVIRRRVNRLTSVNPLRPGRMRWERGLHRGLQLLGSLIPAALERSLDERMRDEVARRYEGVYAESNRKLADLTGLPLHELGYDCGR